MDPTPKKFANLWLPVPKRQAFTYAVPATWEGPLQVGQLVKAPLGRRTAIGMVEGLLDELPEGLVQVKELLEPLPEDCSIDANLLRLFRWAKDHYLAPPGEVLRTFFPAPLLKGKTDKGERARPPTPLAGFSSPSHVSLTAAQKQAVQEVTGHLGNFHPSLLQGVTGSGKTEVYLRLCEEVLRQGGGALILVPEIALTPQTVGRFAGRFGDQVGSYHSGMTETQRLQTWWAVKEGRLKVVVGTRSAVCLPMKDLQIIIIDEEHDPSYKQEERFRYHGRDLAVVRASVEKIPILLGTATPSMETRENVQRKKYHHLLLPDRATAGVLPKIHLVDIKEHLPHPETLLSEALSKKLKETLERGEQALFFLNRRGFSPFLLCNDCGEVARCPNCEISLTYHKRPLSLRCHYCEYSIPVMDECTKCSGPELKPMGSGTERIEEAFTKEYPGIRVGRLDRDVVQSRKRTEELLSQFAAGELDVLIGTQLVTKGHDFKKLTLVGILLADLTLNVPDFRAAERVFQIVTQVAGRAGRHEFPGEVFLQTYRPDHYAILSALDQDPESFFVQERAYREGVQYPPFSRAILFRFSGIHAPRVEEACKYFSDSLKTLFRLHEEVKIMGPAKATLEKLRGKYRWQVLLRTPKFEGVRRILDEKLNYIEGYLPAGVRLSVDVDPLGVF